MIQKKLLVFHPGLATYRVDFFNALNETFDTQFYFSFKYDNSHLFSQESLKKKIRFQPNYVTRGLNFKNKAIRTGIIKIIEKNEPDIVICSEYSQITLLVALYKYLFRKPFKLYTICDDSLTMAKNRNAFKALIKNALDNMLDGIIFSSHIVGNYYQKSTQSRIKILELPIIHNEVIFRKELENSFSLAKEMHKKHKLGGRKIILFVGRLAHEKNLKTLISAINEINDPNLRLFIIGDGPLKEELMHLTGKFQLENKIYFLGKKDGEALMAWYNLAHIFVLPSSHEPFGAVVNEALLAGSRVLCSELAGASSLIDGHNGLTFNPFDQKDLIYKLESLLRTLNPLKDTISELRDNQMRYTFSEKIDRLVRQL